MAEKSKHKQKHLLRRLVILALLIICGYFGVVVYGMLHPRFVYETVMPCTMTDSIFMDGLVLFEESTVQGGGNLGYLVPDGERVSVGTRVAEIYTAPGQSNNRHRLLTVEEQISLLQKSQNTSAAQIDMLLAQSKTAVYDLLDGIEYGNYASLQEDKNNFLLAQNRIQITTGDVQDFNERIDALKQQREQLEASLSETQPVTVTTGGYFVSRKSAAALRLSQQEILELSPAELAALLEQGAESEGEATVGKVVTSYRWYFCGSCTPEQAARFDGVRKVSIRFPGKAEKILSANVIRVEKDEASGTAMLVLQCEQIGAEVLRLGQEKIEIIFQTFRGLRISKTAVHMVKEEQAASGAEDTEDTRVNVDENYQNGVYIRCGSIARFRKVEPIFDGEDCILVPLDGKVGTQNEIRMYDEVIVEGNDLRNGKVL